MRNAGMVAMAMVVGLGAWIGLAAWRWRHGDMEALFRARIAEEAPSGTVLTFTPGTLLVGDLSDTARLVCGTMQLQGADGPPAPRTYSVVVVKTLFGHAINDGFTPATRPENQALSDRSCSTLRLHQAGRPT